MGRHRAQHSVRSHRSVPSFDGRGGGDGGIIVVVDAIISKHFHFSGSEKTDGSVRTCLNALDQGFFLKYRWMICQLTQITFICVFSVTLLVRTVIRVGDMVIWYPVLTQSGRSCITLYTVNVFKK